HYLSLFRIFPTKPYIPVYSGDLGIHSSRFPVISTHHPIWPRAAADSRAHTHPPEYSHLYPATPNRYKKFHHWKHKPPRLLPSAAPPSAYKPVLRPAPSFWLSSP